MELKQRKLSTQLKIALGAGSVLLAGNMNVANASDVRGFGQDNIQNTNDLSLYQIEGVESLGFRIPASNTAVTLSGYVRGDFRYDDSSDLGDSFVVSSIPADGSAGDERDGHIRLHARQSRLIVSSETELSNGKKLTTRFEGDFFGNGGNESFSNSTSFRLRNAVASYDKWLIGQTWTNFMDFVAYPTTVDFFGPAGKSFARQGQIRYTLDNGLSFSIENPETDGNGALGRIRESTGGPGADLLPDFTAAWRGGPGGAGGSYEISGIVRVLGVEGNILELEDPDDEDSDLVPTGPLVDETTTGFGVNLAGGWSFGPVSFAGSVTFGDGIGRYIINGAGNGVFVEDDGDLDAVSAVGYSANVKYDWTENSSSLLAIGGFENGDTAANGIDNLQTIHLNYIWSPYPSSSFGVEIIQGFNESAGGDEGSATRFAFGAQLNF